MCIPGDNVRGTVLLWAAARFVSLLQSVMTTQHPLQWVLEVIPLWVKWPGCGADHNPQNNSEV